MLLIEGIRANKKQTQEDARRANPYSPSQSPWSRMTPHGGRTATSQDHSFLVFELAVLLSFLFLLHITHNEFLVFFGLSLSNEIHASSINASPQKTTLHRKWVFIFFNCIT